MGILKIKTQTPVVQIAISEGTQVTCDKCGCKVKFDSILEIDYLPDGWLSLNLYGQKVHVEDWVICPACVSVVKKAAGLLQ